MSSPGPNETGPTDSARSAGGASHSGSQRAADQSPGGMSTSVPSSGMLSARVPYRVDGAIIAVTLLTGGGLWGLAQLSPVMPLLAMVLATAIGITATLVASAWGAAVAFGESTSHGLWFALFPPYMIWYAARRWSQLHTPTVLFFCGVLLTFGLMAAVLRDLPT